MIRLVYIINWVCGNEYHAYERNGTEETDIHFANIEQFKEYIDKNHPTFVSEINELPERCIGELRWGGRSLVKDLP